MAKGNLILMFSFRFRIIDIVQRDQTLRSIITRVDHGISLLLGNTKWYLSSNNNKDIFSLTCFVLILKKEVESIQFIIVNSNSYDLLHPLGSSSLCHESHELTFT